LFTFTWASAKELGLSLILALSHCACVQVLYNLFDWPPPWARLVVVGVANTMDLPERLGGKMQSRLGCERIVFQSYTRQQVDDCTLSP